MIDSIYRQVYERKNHCIGLVRAPLPETSIYIACSCGYEDTWTSLDTQYTVVKRFNRHVSESDL